LSAKQIVIERIAELELKIDKYENKKLMLSSGDDRVIYIHRKIKSMKKMCDLNKMIYYNMGNLQ